ncbi:MAG: glycine dehydrogenase (aminomethyl-transferring) [Rhodospirillaceae bacterium]|nr:glycine dehydrogenase (aminomethyl-transferring) [Rhodospirillaceae bacterium]|tara:strand:+ start:1738 stop:4641 length:2904 start_codon:yes stop_codon:yes gene_type:complete
MTNGTDVGSEFDEDSEFLARHIGPNSSDQEAMLRDLGMASLDKLLQDTVPPKIKSKVPLNLPDPLSEAKALERLRLLADRIKVNRSLIGTGYYPSLMPGVIQRNILENPAWYTAYTPYQPEISQGRLEALLNFQTVVCDLTGMQIANASLLDEATAAAEAMVFCRKLSKKESDVFFISCYCHPQIIDVVKTRAQPIGIKIVIGDEFNGVGDQPYAALLQYPCTNGEVRDYTAIAKKLQENGAMVIAAADLLALALLKPPGEWGADVVVGSSQRFGVPLGFGGPHAAYFATREKYKRSIPGRIVGLSKDSHGNRALRLALQTREQHIRREKATSNICTAQVLLAVLASMYAVYHGPNGIKSIAKKVHRLTNILAIGLKQLGYEVETNKFFDTIVVKTDDWTASVIEAARVEGINLRVFPEKIGISIDETCDRELIERLWSLMAFDTMKQVSFESLNEKSSNTFPASLARSSGFMEHSVFNSYQSETEMLRYIRKLGDKDIALDKSMIPLGSCTMKLNATTEMIPVTWPEFSKIHPFAPRDQVEGYIDLITQLEEMLCACTGYAAVSLQPNAGSQGEYAGLLAIRAYHRSRSEGHRDVCLIPSSAHGTNPASASMCGMRVVVVKCDDSGNVDVEDLKKKTQEYSEFLAALMVTYPSTHGVFEESILQICEIIHNVGGQVYIDGANLNALVGLCEPGKFGADVSHLNLHKTFCIPHGGGGPGVGPVAVAAHLAPFLPGHRFGDNPESIVGAVSGAPWGSAGILPIPWVYITLMGGTGMRLASEIAILNANYIATKLNPHYPVLYTGSNGLVAHECVIDLRKIKEVTGVDVEDVAKRLIDYGFHAPTMSFPVPGTLMIEPTESESKRELDRFIEAMIAIRSEIKSIENGEVELEESPLTNAPHTAMTLAVENWDRKYSRSEAVFPTGNKGDNKYWPPVSRIDNVYGDRNLICSCPPITDYEYKKVTTIGEG